MQGEVDEVELVDVAGGGRVAALERVEEPVFEDEGVGAGTQRRG